MAGGYRATLGIPGIRAFIWTQFLGAFNDNVLRMIVLFYAVRTLGAVEGPAIVGAVFIVPFLLFSGWAGHLADTRSKRSVIVAIDRSECASVRWPCCEKSRLKSSSAPSPS